MTNAKRRKRWLKLLADYRITELRTREWCEKNGVTDHQLRYWLRKLGQTDESSSWACIELVDEVKQNPQSTLGESLVCRRSDSAVSVRLGAATVNVHPGFDPSILTDVLRVVASTC